ncbi:Anaphase-promoting complex subunit 4 WD40 domain, partial [Trinorchestia longiramus]
HPVSPVTPSPRLTRHPVRDRLTGGASVRSKNVSLELVSERSQLSRGGVCQLFTVPHPAAVLPQPHLPLASDASSAATAPDAERGSSDTPQTPPAPPPTKPPTSLVPPPQRGTRTRPSLSEDPRVTSATTREQREALISALNSSPIDLPKGYNPLTALTHLEVLYNFTLKTGAELPLSPDTMTRFNGPPVAVPKNLDDGPPVTMAKAWEDRRARDVLAVGCVVVEVFAAAKCRVLGFSAPLEERYALCKGIVASAAPELPRALRHTLHTIFQVDPKAPHQLKPPVSHLPSADYDAVSASGLPPPSPHLLLQPLVELFPYPLYYPKLHGCLAAIHHFSALIVKAQILERREKNFFKGQTDGQEKDAFKTQTEGQKDAFKSQILDVREKDAFKGQTEGQEKDAFKTQTLEGREKDALCERLSERRLGSAVCGASSLLPGLPREGLSLLLPAFLELYSCPWSAVSCAWHLTAMLAEALGPEDAKVHLLVPLVRLFETEVVTDKYLKLYHRTFLLQLIVRFGLKTFLLHFIIPLIEGVGGAKHLTTSRGADTPDSSSRKHSATLRSVELGPAAEGGGGGGFCPVSRLRTSEALPPEEEDDPYLLPQQEEASTGEQRLSVGEETEQEEFVFEDPVEGVPAPAGGVTSVKSPPVSDSISLDDVSLQEPEGRVPPSSGGSHSDDETDDERKRFSFSSCLSRTEDVPLQGEDTDPDTPTPRNFSCNDKRKFMGRKLDDCYGDGFPVNDEDDEEEMDDPSEIASLSSPHVLSPSINIPGQSKPDATSEFYSSSLPTMRLSKNKPTADIVMEDTSDVGYDVLDDSFLTQNSSASRVSENKSDDRSLESRSNFQSHECSIADVCYESVLWLGDRLGPVLTSKYLTRNLLRMLTLCYLPSNGALTPILPDPKDALSVTRKWVMGDRTSARVLDCLSSLACLYGEKVIMVQYVTHVCDFIGSCRKKLTVTTEAGLLGCAALLQHLLPYISDSTFMSCLQETLIKDALYPLIRLLASTRVNFPSGAPVRGALACRVVDIIFIMGLRVGREMSKKLLMRSIVRLLTTFDRVYLPSSGAILPGSSPKHAVLPPSRGGTLPARPDGGSAALSSGGTFADRGGGRSGDGFTTSDGGGNDVGHPDRISCGGGGGMDVADGGVDSSGVGKSSDGPPKTSVHLTDDPEIVRTKALKELKEIFTPELAYLSYYPLCRFLGARALETCLPNHELLRSLCIQHDENLQNNHAHCITMDNIDARHYPSKGNPTLGVFATNRGETDSCGVSVTATNVTGNRIDISDSSLSDSDTSQLYSQSIGFMNSVDISTYLSTKMDNSKRHLRGNWLAYWNHEIGRSDHDTTFNFNHIKLQSFVGHTNSIKNLHVLNNENSFMSCSKDKTVRLWSLRSEGDGSAQCSPQFTYTRHKKSVFGITFCERHRLAASCDSAVHIWDPFVGAMVRQLDSLRHSPVTVLACVSAPSSELLAATTDATLRVVDLRTRDYAHQYRVSASSAGLVRSVVCSDDGRLVCVAHSSGIVAVLDRRTGNLLATWKPHEGEVLCCRWYKNRTFLSSALDQTIAVWNVNDSSSKFTLKGPTEPVHLLQLYQDQVVTATTANRIGHHTSVASDATYTSYRLRSDSLKGVVTAMEVLPLNRMLLLGSDSGALRLLC